MILITQQLQVFFKKRSSLIDLLISKFNMLLSFFIDLNPSLVKIFIYEFLSNDKSTETLMWQGFTVILYYWLIYLSKSWYHYWIRSFQEKRNSLSIGMSHQYPHASLLWVKRKYCKDVESFRFFVRIIDNDFRRASWN